MIRRTLKVPFVTLRLGDLEDIADRIIEQDAEDWSSLDLPERPDADDPESVVAVRELRLDAVSMLRRHRDLPFKIETSRDESEGFQWKDLLDAVDPEDIRSIAMRSSAGPVQTEVFLGFSGYKSWIEGGSTVKVVTETADQMRTEVGFYTDLFDRRRSVLRLLAGGIWGYAVLLIGIPALAVWWYTAMIEGDKSSGAVSTVFWGSLYLGAAPAMYVLFRLTPRCILEGGPGQRFRGALRWLAAGVALAIIGYIVTTTLATLAR